MHVSDITSTAEDTAEAGIAYLDPDGLLCVLRDTAEAATYQRRSYNMGTTWGALEDITAQVAVIQAPRMQDFGDGRIYLWGRNRQQETVQQISVYSTKDAGLTWEFEFNPDVDTCEDCGYGDVLQRSDDQFYMLCYAGTGTQSDIMQYVFADE